LFGASDEEVWQKYRAGLLRVIPELKDGEIEQRFIFRERLVQPIPVMNYSALVPDMRTNVEHLFLANTTQIVNSTLNNNEMVKIARKAADLAAQTWQSQNELLRQDTVAEIAHLGR
jgi:hypothetical protein